MSAAADAVSLASLWKFHGHFAALKDVNLRIRGGSCFALLGRNGAGKTTLLRILAGLSEASQGSVRILGSAPRETSARLRSGYLGHGTGIYDELTARENLLHAAALYAITDPGATASSWLERVGLGAVPDARAREFSRGMRQRLALARVFLPRPELLLLDEPFTSLDDRAVALLQNLLRDALALGATVVISTHQLREALDLATDVGVLDRGKLVFIGPRTSQMIDDPASVYSAPETAG